jgi:DNA primase
LLPDPRGPARRFVPGSLSKNVFHCFACQASGNVLDFVAAMERCSIRAAALRLQQWFGIGATEPSTAGAEWRKRELVREKEKRNPPLRFALTGIDHGHPYLVSRGIDWATATDFGIGFYAGPGLMSGRIVIPIGNVEGKTVAYAGRSLDGKLPKYKLPAGFQKSLEIFNLHRAAATGSNRVIVVEGYFDCLRVQQAGLPWVVALMGSSLSTDQEDVLLQRFDSVVLMLDGDAAGRAATRAIAVGLSGRCSVGVVRVPDGTQPDQLSLTAIQELVGDSEIRQRDSVST